MKDKVKLGIAGCGFAGTQTMYATILRLLEKGRVTALMDPNQRALDFMTQNYGDFDCYDDYGDFLAKADAVYPASWQEKTIRLPLSGSGDLEQIFREMRMQYGG